MIDQNNIILANLSFNIYNVYIKTEIKAVYYFYLLTQLRNSIEYILQNFTLIRIGT